MVPACWLLGKVSMGGLGLGLLGRGGPPPAPPPAPLPRPPTCPARILALHSKRAQLVAHVSANKVILRRWEEGSVREWSAISYPNQVSGRWWRTWSALTAMPCWRCLLFTAFCPALAFSVFTAPYPTAASSIESTHQRND